MVRTLSSNVTDLITNKYEGLESIILVGINHSAYSDIDALSIDKWSNSIVQGRADWYGTKAYTLTGVTNQITNPSTSAATNTIVSISELNYTLDVTNTKSIATAVITLDDTVVSSYGGSKFLIDIYADYEIVGRRACIYHVFNQYTWDSYDGNNRFNRILLLDGKVTSFSYDDKNRLATISIEEQLAIDSGKISYVFTKDNSYLIDNEPGFNFPNELYDQPLPLVFGTVQYHKLVPINIYSGGLLTSFNSLTKSVKINSTYPTSTDIDLDFYTEDHKKFVRTNGQLYSDGTYTFTTQNDAIFSNISLLDRRLNKYYNDAKVIWIDSTNVIDGMYCLIYDGSSSYYINKCIKQIGDRCHFVNEMYSTYDNYENDYSSLDSTYTIVETSYFIRDSWADYSGINYPFVAFTSERDSNSIISAQIKHYQSTKNEYSISQNGGIKRVDIASIPDNKGIWLIDMHTNCNVDNIWGYQERDEISGLSRLIPTYPINQSGSDSKLTIDPAFKLMNDENGQDVQGTVAIAKERLNLPQLYAKVHYDVAHPIDVIEELLDSNTSIKPDRTSFDVARSRVSVRLNRDENIPFGCVIPTGTNVIETCNRIAWQCKCFLNIRNNVAYIKYLAYKDDVVPLNDLDEEGITVGTTRIEELVNSYVVSYNQHSELVSFEKQWFETNIDSPVTLSRRNNDTIEDFGKFEQSVDFIASRDPEWIGTVMDYWLLRNGYIWKTFNYIGYLDTLKLELNDLVSFSARYFENLPFLALDSTVYGFVKSINYANIIEGIFNIELILSIRPEDDSTVDELFDQTNPIIIPTIPPVTDLILEPDICPYEDPEIREDDPDVDVTRFTYNAQSHKVVNYEANEDILAKDLRAGLNDAAISTSFDVSTNADAVISYGGTLKNTSFGITEVPKPATFSEDTSWNPLYILRPSAAAYIVEDTADTHYPLDAVLGANGFLSSGIWKSTYFEYSGGEWVENSTELWWKALIDPRTPHIVNSYYYWNGSSWTGPNVPNPKQYDNYSTDELDEKGFNSSLYPQAQYYPTKKYSTLAADVTTINRIEVDNEFPTPVDQLPYAASKYTYLDQLGRLALFIEDALTIQTSTKLWLGWKSLPNSSSSGNWGFTILYSTELYETWTQVLANATYLTSVTVDNTNDDGTLQYKDLDLENSITLSTEHSRLYLWILASEDYSDDLLVISGTPDSDNRVGGSLTIDDIYRVITECKLYTGTAGNQVEMNIEQVLQSDPTDDTIYYITDGELLEDYKNIDLSDLAYGTPVQKHTRKSGFYFQRVLFDPLDYEGIKEKPCVYFTNEAVTSRNTGDIVKAGYPTSPNYKDVIALINPDYEYELNDGLVPVKGQTYLEPPQEGQTPWFIITDPSPDGFPNRVKVSPYTLISKNTNTTLMVPSNINNDGILPIKAVKYDGKKRQYKTFGTDQHKSTIIVKDLNNNIIPIRLLLSETFRESITVNTNDLLTSRLITLVSEPSTNTSNFKIYLDTDHITTDKIKITFNNTTYTVDYTSSNSELDVTDPNNVYDTKFMVSIAANSISDNNNSTALYGQPYKLNDYFWRKIYYENTSNNLAYHYQRYLSGWETSITSTNPNAPPNSLFSTSFQKDRIQAFNNGYPLPSWINSL